MEKGNISEWNKFQMHLFTYISLNEWPESEGSLKAISDKNKDHENKII